MQQIEVTGLFYIGFQRSAGFAQLGRDFTRNRIQRLAGYLVAIILGQLSHSGHPRGAGCSCLRLEWAPIACDATRWLREHQAT